MNFSMLRSLQGAISTTVSCLVKKVVTPNVWQITHNRGIHQICSQYSSSLTTTSIQSIFKPLAFLAPIIPQVNQICGMKQRGRLQLRCRGCYYVSRQGRLYVMCRFKPRHKQMQMIKSFKKRRILTFAHQKKEREW